MITTNGFGGQCISILGWGDRGVIVQTIPKKRRRRVVLNTIREKATIGILHVDSISADCEIGFNVSSSVMLTAFVGLGQSFNSLLRVRHPLSIEHGQSERAFAGVSRRSSKGVSESVGILHEHSKSHEMSHGMLLERKLAKRKKIKVSKRRLAMAIDGLFDE